MANCDCYNERVSTYTGSISGNPQVNVDKIHYCPLHAAAGELLSSLEEMSLAFIGDSRVAQLKARRRAADAIYAATAKAEGV